MKCSHCNLDKTEKDFYKGKTHNGNRCKECRRKESNKWRNSNYIRSLSLKCRHRAKQKGIPFTITLEYLEEVWREQNGRCAVSGLPFEAPQDFASNKSSKFQYNPFGPSIDRIIPSKGYVRDNVRFVLCSLNAALGVHGLNHYMEVAKAVLANQGSL